MEKLVAVELRVVVTRIAAAERVSLSGNGELTGHGRGPRKTGRADPLVNGHPDAACAVVYGDCASVRVYKIEPIRRSVILLSPDERWITLSFAARIPPTTNDISISLTVRVFVTNWRHL